MKRMGWFRKRGLGIGVLLASAGVWMLAQALPSAAADPAAELKTAITHAGYSAKQEALQGATTHLHHVLNCLVGPQGQGFYAAAGNPCQGQGNGYLPDLKGSKGETDQYYEAMWAAKVAELGLASNNLAETKAASRVVIAVLDSIAKGQ
jgi:hypothetical protein